jgi:hypothetical protein
MSSFELPIYHLDNKQTIDKNIIDDLELLETNGETDMRDSLLQTVYNPTSKIGKLNLKKHTEYFTNNKLFLKQTQKIINDWKTDDNIGEKQKTYDDFHELWETLKNDDTFIDRYYYVDVEYFKFLNNSGPFLQILSIYNLLSPIITLLIPIILMIVPFFMLKFNGVSINMQTYYRVLTDIFSKHALGSIGNIVGEVSLEKRMYALISIAFYFFSVYQNSLVCYRFYKNFYSIHNDLFLLNTYLTTTIENINRMEENISQHNTYTPFLVKLQCNKQQCVNLKEQLDRIRPFSLRNFTQKSSEIGFVMKYFYEIHTNEDIRNTIEYSIGFNAYMEHMNGLKLLHREKLINKCNFGKKMKMEKSFYPYLLHTEPVKNDIQMNKNIIITGPNASGKTTILKTILFNQIFSQSCGFGFYSKATIPLYNSIHCYLNIPDTSGRDSLFQAEARRCKEIIDSLEDKQKHFCIFDELFSGTNPNEASASSYGFIKYLNNLKNIDFVLTTHLVDICYKLDGEVINSNMNVKQIDDFNFEYTYNITAGISSIKGGLKVLADLQYPKCILDDSIKYFKEE